MLRSTYQLLIRLHPVAFKERFGDGILEIFDAATGLSAELLLIADGLVSLWRQWVLRPEFREPVLAASADAPLFRVLQPYRPHPAALFEDALTTALTLYAVVAMIGTGGGVTTHHPHASDRDASERFRFNVTTPSGYDPEESAGSIAAEYFRKVRVLDALDADHDLIISHTEILGAPAALRKLDANHDGRLSPEECGFISGRDATASARRAFMRANPVLAVLDADHDGEISAREIENSPSALKILDRNKDGRLTPSEIVPEQEL